jgi:phosphoribosyl 1,2-cyclic phosphate phosphodiesterase
MKMIATVLGSGTSMGVPPIGCDEAACLSDDPKNKRLRAGLWLREAVPEPARARGLIVDCGPDYRQQALTHRIHRLNGLLITHAHFDHVSGLDDLRIYNFRQGQPLPMRARPDVLTDIRKRMDYIFDPPQLGGGVASFDMQPLEGPFEFLGMRILPIPVKHGILDILGFRFGDFGFVTDASAIPPESMAMLKGVRVLILNALRHKPHSTHFSLDEAVAAARKIGAERTWFVHMTHHLEHHATNALLPKGIELAFDGLQFEFQPEWTGEPFGGQP